MGCDINNNVATSQGLIVNQCLQKEVATPKTSHQKLFDVVRDFNTFKAHVKEN